MQKQRQRSSRLFGEQNLFNSLPRFACLDPFQPFLPNRPRQNSQRGKELNKFCPQTDATTFAFASVSTLLLWHQSFLWLDVDGQQTLSNNSQGVKALSSSLKWQPFAYLFCSSRHCAYIMWFQEKGWKYFCRFFIIQTS